MEPPENGPEDGDSMKTSLSLGRKQKTITVGVDAPNFEPLADVEQVVKKGTSSDEVSRDESCKTLEDSEVSLSIDVKPVEVEEHSIASDGQGIVSDGQGAVSPGENLVDRQSNAFESTELELGNRGADVIRNISDIEQDCDLADPLEFARQVAIEVEREVVDCREESSSSDAVPESVNQLSDNLASEAETRTRVQLDLSKEPPSEEGLSEGTLELTEDEPASSAENHANQKVNATQEIESSQVTDRELALLLSGNTSVCEFDLNEEVCVEKIDGQEKQISTPIAASSAATAPASPFQFEGNLGWKGSSDTSAFQATLLFQALEVDKVHSVGGSNNSSKQEDDCHGIDLNTHDSLDEESAEPLTESNNQEPYGFLSWESSAVKASQRISEKPKLDLNYATDDSDGASDSQAKGGYHNINLNDHPSLDSEHSGPYFINAPVATNSNESVISLFGVNLGVNKRDAIPNPVPTFDANLPRTGGGVFGIEPAVPYAHLPVFGYTGFSPAPAGAMPSGMYGLNGPFPYMFDPTAMNATSTIQPVFTHPHMLSMSSMNPGSHVVEPSEHNLDLNTGQRLFTGHGRLMEDNLMSNSHQTSNLIAGMKRREPDSGWEPEHILPFKLLQPTWK